MNSRTLVGRELVDAPCGYKMSFRCIKLNCEDVLRSVFRTANVKSYTT